MTTEKQPMSLGALLAKLPEEWTAAERRFLVEQATKPSRRGFTALGEVGERVEVWAEAPAGKGRAVSGTIQQVSATRLVVVGEGYVKRQRGGRGGEEEEGGEEEVGAEAPEGEEVAP